VKQLEEKQNLILQKLDELKQTLMLMRGDLQCQQQQPTQQHPKLQQQHQKQQKVAKIQKKPIDVSYLDEIVINVHPKNTPFSILSLKSLWKGRLDLQIQVFTHSSICESEINKVSKEFAEMVSAQSKVESNVPSLKVTIIWKNVETTQMVCSPSKFIPVYGEINIIRFFNRIGPSEFSYEVDNHAANLHDQILDICYQLSKKHSNKDKQQFVHQLSQRLGKDKFFNNETSLSISDIAVVSILRKLFAENSKEIPGNLSTWLQTTSKLCGY
jgi:Thioredoxin-like domain